MIKQFISQNINRTKLVNNAKLYYYGPDFKNSNNNENTTSALFGVSFDYGLEFDEDTENYFTIEFTVDYAIGAGSSSSFNRIKQVSYTVNIQDPLDYGINDGNNTDFVFPVDLGTDVLDVEHIRRISNVSLTIAKPSLRYTYVTPTELSTNSKYINVLQGIQIDGTMAGNYKGTVKITLDDSSAQESICEHQNEFDFYSDPHSDQYTSTFILRSKITGSAAIVPHIQITGGNEKGVNDQCRWSTYISSYYMKYPDYSVEAIFEESAIYSKPLPSTGKRAWISGSKCIEESNLGEFIYYHVDLIMEAAL